MRHAVLEFHSFFDRLVFDDVQNRGERLFLHDGPLVLRLHNAGRDVTIRGFVLQLLTAADDFPPLLLDDLYRSHHILHGGPIDERTH